MPLPDLLPLPARASLRTSPFIRLQDPSSETFMRIGLSQHIDLVRVRTHAQDCDKDRDPGLRRRALTAVVFFRETRCACCLLGRRSWTYI